MFNVEHKIYSGNNFCAFAKFPDLYSLLHQKFLYSVTGTVWKGNHMYTYIIRRRRRRRQRRRRRRRRRRREEEKKGRRRRRRRRRRKIRRVSNVTAMEHSPITTEQVEWKQNAVAHAQKPDLVFQRNGRVHFYWRGCQFSRLLAAEVCASAVVMLDRPCPIQGKTAGYPLHSPFSPSLLHPCVSVCHQIPFLLYLCWLLKHLTGRHRDQTE